QKKPLSKIISDLYAKVGTYLTRRLNFKLTQAEKDRLTEKVKADPTEFGGMKVTKVIRVDGTKFLLENDAWILIRMSGTEPVVRFYAEAKEEKTLDQLCKHGENWVRNA
ncbi:MAG TPA: phosphoglucomutase/phosphomannomutase family protein, partial [Candidatus Ozemobacteraceae bacterium]|nr:phosphoglucomutase/phosphomannomutase family protein [Candidatus Ozemobacteraceae bacterium]